MKIRVLLSFLLCVGSWLRAQQTIPLPERILQGVDQMWIDDYGNVYLLNTDKLSFSKYDSLGTKKGDLLRAVPFQVQSVSNPLTIPLFSKNVQELRLIDQNLTEIQDPIAFPTNFTHVDAVYFEDLQYAWIIDDVQKTLSKWDYRNAKVVKSYLLNNILEYTKNFIVYRDHIYVSKENNFEVYNLSGKLIFQKETEKIVSLERKNNEIFLILKNEIWKFDSNLIRVFEAKDATAVAGNFKNWVAIQHNKLYFYPRKN